MHRRIFILIHIIETAVNKIRNNLLKPRLNLYGGGGEGITDKLVLVILLLSCCNLKQVEGQIAEHFSFIAIYKLNGGRSQPKY